MNRDRIQSCISELGHDVRLTQGDSKLIVEFTVGSQTVTLSHTFPDELLSLPRFDLVGDYSFGNLAHVLTDGNGNSGEVCIADQSSTVVNTDQPELAYRDTVQEHVRLLTRLIEDPAYNREELLREFQAHWEVLCVNAAGQPNELFVAWDGDNSESLQVRSSRAGSATDLYARPFALAGTLANDPRSTSVRHGAGWGRRRAVGKALAARLDGLDPAPATQRELLEWYFRVVTRMDSTGRHELERLHRTSSRDYWLVFSAPIPDGEAIFALHWHAPSKRGLPATVEKADGDRWKATAYRVRSLSRGSLVPRGGGSLDLRSKSVLLVGCGSVGSDVALRLTSAGVGQLTISDPEKFSEENLYRHTLSVKDVGRLKSQALAEEIARKHPWAEVTHWFKSLEHLRKPAVLRPFDLVVVAIGSPNVERAFAEFCSQESIAVPVINCWLEGYGIGGHAIMTIPRTKGCWHCAYVDTKTLTRGLTSNLNFLAPDQTVMRNHGGCGAQFLPYSGIAAAYTASIAADLAVRFLEGQISISSKVSWKGSDEEAKRQSLEMTWRYRHFNESLCILPLYNDSCDLCGA